MTPLEQLTEALAQLRHLPEGAFVTLQITVPLPASSLLGGPTAGPKVVAREADPAGEPMLTAKQVAVQLGVKERWVYDHKKQLGGRQLSAHCLRFPAAGIRRYLESKAVAGQAPLALTRRA
jgi:hypothetical protein